MTKQIRERKTIDPAFKTRNRPLSSKKQKNTQEKPPALLQAADKHKLIISWRTAERHGRLPDRIAVIVTVENPCGIRVSGLRRFGCPLSCPIQMPSKCDKTDQRTKGHRSCIQDKEPSPVFTKSRCGNRYKILQFCNVLSRRTGV